MTLVTQPEITQLIKGLCDDVDSVPDYLIEGNNYQLPTTEWVLGNYSQDLRWQLQKLGMNQYVPEVNCCRQYAHFAMFVAARCQLSAARNEAIPHPLAFGFVALIAQNGGGHAINCFVTRENDQPALKFYEPQTQQLVELTPFEKTHIQLILI